jgi:hypothetical protein
MEVQSVEEIYRVHSPPPRRVRPLFQHFKSLELLLSATKEKHHQTLQYHLVIYPILILSSPSLLLFPTPVASIYPGSRCRQSFTHRNQGRS